MDIHNYPIITHNYPILILEYSYIIMSAYNGISIEIYLYFQVLMDYSQWISTDFRISLFQKIPYLYSISSYSIIFVYL